MNKGFILFRSAIYIQAPFIHYHTHSLPHCYGFNITGGKLLQKELGDTESVNEDYIQVISDLFHYKNGQFDAIEKKKSGMPDKWQMN